MSRITQICSEVIAFKDESPHLVAGLLKAFFMCLPEPVFPISQAAANKISMCNAFECS